MGRGIDPCSADSTRNSARRPTPSGTITPQCLDHRPVRQRPFRRTDMRLRGIRLRAEFRQSVSSHGGKIWCSAGRGAARGLRATPRRRRRACRRADCVMRAAAPPALTPRRSPPPSRDHGRPKCWSLNRYGRRTSASHRDSCPCPRREARLNAHLSEPRRGVDRERAESGSSADDRLWFVGGDPGGWLGLD